MGTQFVQKGRGLETTFEKCKITLRSGGRQGKGKITAIFMKESDVLLTSILRSASVNVSQPRRGDSGESRTPGVWIEEIG